MYNTKMETQLPTNRIYYVPTNKMELCVTFDDSPESSPGSPTTNIILQILKNYNIKATFFVLTENVLRNPDIVKRIIDEGHTIGLHGYTHKSFRKHPKLTIYRHIKKSLDILDASFSVSSKNGPLFFRPPFGTFTPETEIVCNQFNMIPAGWCILEKDYQARRVLTKSNNIIKKCSPGKILCLHDGFRNFKHEGATIEILKVILPQLIAQGYNFVSIPELVSCKSHAYHKVFNGVPLLFHEIIDYTKSTILFLYWDIDLVKSAEDTFQLKIMDNNKIIYDAPVKFPNPSFMKEWSGGIDFPLGAINKGNEIFINNINVKL